MAAPTTRTGGRAFGRGLVDAALIALCALGIVLTARGAIIPIKAAVAQVLLERAFDRSVAAREPQKPWPWADMAPVARLAIPRLGVDRVVLDTGSGQAMAFGPTLLPGGARLGAPGTTVIAAHRDTHFHFLQRLRLGDRIMAEGLDGRTHRYRVVSTAIVRWDRFAIPEGGEMLALATCYPFDAVRHGPLRYVVFAATDR
ncbi:class GN sortase [Flavisphingomonas formosensis]|uniref:class GN sortase n=1 Tax=Flavisphingomonas formosensis TaxID=861534 RepID=UPI0012FC43AB|nr:class GN sortase [Sphingomonas formosensis]